MSKTLFIFLKNATTLRFGKVTELDMISSSRILTFNYVSASENVSRAAVFYIGSIVGYSVSDTPEPEEVNGFDKYLKGDK